MSRETLEAQSSSTENSWGVLKAVRVLKQGDRVKLKVKINDKNVEILYDPGGAQSVISELTWKAVGAPSQLNY